MNEGKLNWGILGSARIATRAVIPGMQRSKIARITAIASRKADTARITATQYGIPKHYGSYEKLLEDQDIDAVYIPLPNHLHVEWSKKALEAGKHVLCEKPLALTTAEIHELIKLRNKKKLKIGEAFMVHTHPQWIQAHGIVRSQKFGQLRLIQGHFSYFNRDSNNIRNSFPTEKGGGGLWDIGCYPIHTSRFIFGEEPQKVIAAIERDKEFPIDRLASAILQFPSGQAIFSSSTQLVPWQQMSFYGEKQRLEIKIPFNPPDDRPAILQIHDGQDLALEPKETLIPPTNQYGIQADEFSRAVLNNTEVPVPLEDTLYNTAVIRALFQSAETGTWVEPSIE